MCPQLSVKSCFFPKSDVKLDIICKQHIIPSAMHNYSLNFIMGSELDTRISPYYLSVQHKNRDFVWFVHFHIPRAYHIVYVQIIINE